MTQHSYQQPVTRPGRPQHRSLSSVLTLLVVLAVTGCAKTTEHRTLQPEIAEQSGQQSAAQPSDYSATLVVAGGCFWCVESDLEKLPGVGDVVAGYAGGPTSNPTYRNHADHLEVVQAPYDPTRISYAEIIDYFLRHIDPLDSGGQFCDRGHSYTTAVFYATPEERKIAEAALASAAEELGQAPVTPVIELDKFWIAEDYHQNYYKKNPIRYNYYRRGCGRDARVAQVWGKDKK